MILSNRRGCETWIVREGYEGLVRGNSESDGKHTHITTAPFTTGEDINLIHNLRFGDGQLLKDGTGDYSGGRTLKGRYIVRVGWDDVRGWFAEVRLAFVFANLPRLRRYTIRVVH